MSRVAKKPILIPNTVEVSVQGGEVSIKGRRGVLSMLLHPTVSVSLEGGEMRVVPASTASQHRAMAGTMRALLNNMVLGVDQGFERKLQLVGTGYRAQVNAGKLNLSLGFSHPVEFVPPEGITVEAPTQTEIVVRGNDKQQVGEVAAKIRAYRPPEPYKGKGVRYVNEQVVIKEAKKK